MAVELHNVALEPGIKERIMKFSDVSHESISKLYTLKDELGRGRFSVVRSATHKKEGATYAVKVVENSSLTDEENLEALETEIAILRQLNHPHIVSLKEVVTTPSDTYIVMELLGGGELFNRIVDDGPFPEPKAASLFAQILFAMEHLHEQNIVHRDIKPENILYIEKGGLDIKLIDFGYAGLWAPDKQLTGLCGTPDYVAPEVLTWYDDDDEKGTPYGKGSDLWSMGVLLYVILSGCSPFSADEEEMLLQQVAQAKYEFYDNEWKGVSELAKDLVRKLLVVDPAERLSMEQVMAHPWLETAVATCRHELEQKQSDDKGVAGGKGGAGGQTAPGGKTGPVESVEELADKKDSCCVVS